MLIERPGLIWKRTYIYIDVLERQKFFVKRNKLCTKTKNHLDDALYTFIDFFIRAVFSFLIRRIFIQVILAVFYGKGGP